MNLAKAYTPNDYEPNIYALWEASGAFRPKEEGEPYSIVLPPPNANGNLHIGHGLAFNLQDILIRYHRMKGYSTAYIPGADHAGFETWVVYEKSLEAKGQSRFDFSREELYKKVWDFVAEKRGDMELQLRALGLSLDWQSLVFTLDPKVTNTVYDTFQKLWNDNLIYRSKRLVNYCTKHHTAFADIEIAYEEQKTPLYYIKYGPFELATTRPETKFGDTGVAVHPDDDRYRHFVGQELEIEGVNGPFTVKVVADEMVDREFGTGVVKITPAHDFNDWDVAQRHNLPAVNVIDYDGKMTQVTGDYQGMTVAEARKAVAEKLDEKGLLIKVDKNYKNRVGTCYKCGTVIEPMLMDQWFVDVKPLAEKALNAINSGDIRFVPESKGRVLANYLENLQDWNISRQIPWGIAIPAFVNKNDPTDWIFNEDVDQKEIVIDGITYTRDEDTFDTWFSSGQWPYITTDYLDGGELAKHFPNSVMSTGSDILFAWVGRMIMLSLYRTNKVPFKTVYLNGLVNDENNQKMSKSKGNVVNPMEVIAEYGSDAFRMGIVSNRSAAQNQAYAPSKIVAGRNFCNKLWNIARFIEGKQPEDFTPRTPTPETIADHWVLRQLDQAGKSIDKLLADYRFAEAVETVYHTIWDDVADWFVEASKTADNAQIRAYVLEQCLRLAHPFAPFVTETIWQSLSWTKELLINEQWPQIIAYDEIAAAEFERIVALITEARFVMAELPGNKRYGLLYGVDSMIADNEAMIAHLGRFSNVTQSSSAKGLRLAASGRDAWLDIDADTLYEHQTNLERRLAETRQEITKLQGRLSNENYITKAPVQLVEESRKSLAELQSREDRLVKELSVL